MYRLGIRTYLPAIISLVVAPLVDGVGIVVGGWQSAQLWPLELAFIGGVTLVAWMPWCIYLSISGRKNEQLCVHGRLKGMEKPDPTRAPNRNQGDKHDAEL